MLRQLGDGQVQDDDLPRIGSPAIRALQSIGITRLSQVSACTEEQLLALHGFGPRALRTLKDRLAEKGLSLSSERRGTPLRCND